MILTRKLVDLLADKKVMRFERSKLPLFLEHDGLIRFTSSHSSNTRVHGNILIDRSMTSPIQVVNWDSEPIGPKYIADTLEKALETRKKNQLPVDNLHSAFRLTNGIADGLPGIAIDLYGPYAMIHVYSQHWQSYVMEIAKSLMKLERRVEGVYAVNRSRKAGSDSAAGAEVSESKKKSQCIWGRKAQDHKTIVEENGLLYHVQLDNGPAIGLYMDQRVNRTKVVNLLKKVQEQYVLGDSKETGYKKPRFLNTFSFTGSFSVAAAVKADAVTTSVDASEVAQLWAKDNFVLNALDPQAHEFVKKDVFTTLAGYFTQNRQFDVVFLDPPTISRVKVRKTGSDRETSSGYVPSISSASGKTHFSALDNYSDLVALASPLVAPGGYMICFVNTHSLDKETWRHSITQGLDSLIPRMKSHLESERTNSVRSYLRKRGVKVKYRNMILNKQKGLKLSDDLLKDHYGFSSVEEWFQDTSDFTVLEGDSMGSYLHGIVLRRNMPKDPLPAITYPAIKENHLHESRKPATTAPVKTEKGSSPVTAGVKGQTKTETIHSAPKAKASPTAKYAIGKGSL